MSPDLRLVRHNHRFLHFLICTYHLKASCRTKYPTDHQSLSCKNLLINDKVCCHFCCRCCCSCISLLKRTLVFIFSLLEDHDALFSLLVILQTVLLATQRRYNTAVWPVFFRCYYQFCILAYPNQTTLGYKMLVKDKIS